MPKIKTPEYWQDACKYLSKQDKKLAKIINAYEGDALTTYDQALRTLVNAIVGQQISVKAAESIWQRLKTLLKNSFTAKKILACPDDDLRATGLSRQKVSYIKNIAQFFIDNKVNKNYFLNTSPEKIKEELLAIKGVGKWTYEMFAIFYLHDSDILPLGDIGLIKAMQNLYFKGQKTEKESLEKFANRWRPYRTVATWYLWRSIDPEVIQY